MNDTKWMQNPIKVTNIFTGETKYFARQTEAAEYYGYSVGSFCLALNHKKIFAKRYTISKVSLEEFFANVGNEFKS